MDILLNTLCSGLVGFFKFYLVMLTLRIYISWFPNINLYGQPFATLGKMTDPYLRLWRGLVPPLVGFDFSPILGFSFLTFLIDVFSSISF